MPLGAYLPSWDCFAASAPLPLCCECSPSRCDSRSVCVCRIKKCVWMDGALTSLLVLLHSCVCLLRIIGICVCVVVWLCLCGRYCSGLYSSGGCGPGRVYPTKQLGTKHAQTVSGCRLWPRQAASVAWGGLAMALQRRCRPVCFLYSRITTQLSSGRWLCPTKHVLLHVLLWRV